MLECLRGTRRNLAQCGAYHELGDAHYGLVEAAIDGAIAITERVLAMPSDGTR